MSHQGLRVSGDSDQVCDRLGSHVLTGVPGISDPPQYLGDMRVSLGCILVSSFFLELDPGVMGQGPRACVLFGMGAEY